MSILSRDDWRNITLALTAHAEQHEQAAKAAFLRGDSLVAAQFTRTADTTRETLTRVLLNRADLEMADLSQPAQQIFRSGRVEVG